MPNCPIHNHPLELDERGYLHCPRCRELYDEHEEQVHADALNGAYDNYGSSE